MRLPISRKKQVEYQLVVEFLFKWWVTISNQMKPCKGKRSPKMHLSRVLMKFCVSRPGLKNMTELLLINFWMFSTWDCDMSLAPRNQRLDYSLD